MMSNPILDSIDVEDRFNSAQYKLDLSTISLANDFKNKPPLERRGTMKNVGGDMFTVGAYALVLDRYDEARHAFTDSAAFKTVCSYIVRMAYREGVDTGGHWQVYLRDAEAALETAILGSDPDVEQRAIGQIRGHTDEDTEGKSYFKYSHHRARALAALVDENSSKARSHVEEARTHIDAVDFTTAEPQLALLDGLADRDTAAIEAAAESLADVHLDGFEPPPANGSQLLSRHAVAGLALARRWGLDVSVDHDAIPSAVCRYDWHHRKHDWEEHGIDWEHCEENPSELAKQALAAVDDDDEDRPWVAAYRE